MRYEDAFAGGVEIAFLTAADERAGRVYERIGFRPYATGLAYAVPGKRSAVQLVNERDSCPSIYPARFARPV